MRPAANDNHTSPADKDGAAAASSTSLLDGILAESGKHLFISSNLSCINMGGGIILVAICPGVLTLTYHSAFLG
jgi:hypothetical protein